MPASVQAAASAFWVDATSCLVTKLLIASVYDWAQPSFAAAPWTTLGTIVWLVQSFIVDWRYSLYPWALPALVLAGIEPLSGLKASCPSTEPASFSQSIAL